MCIRFVELANADLEVGRSPRRVLCWKVEDFVIPVWGAGAGYSDSHRGERGGYN